MRNQLFSRLSSKEPPSYARIADFIASIQTEWEALAVEDKPTFSEYAAKKLLDHFGIANLPDAKLLKFGEHCLKWPTDLPISSRLIVCGSKASIIDPKSGDTILTPEGVWQIDSDFQEQLLLSKTDMERYIPEDLRPNEKTSLKSLVVNDNQTKDANDLATMEHSKRLSEALNQAILAKGHGLYLSSQTTTQRTAATIQTVHTKHVTPVIQNRGLANRLLQQLHLKSDIQFFFLAQQYTQNCFEFFAHRKLRDIKNPVSADDLVEYLDAVLSRRLELHHLSDTQLKELAYLSQTYEPKLSPRIICGGSEQQINDSKELKKGDTIISPDGIFQMDYDGCPRRLLDKKAIAAYPALFHPSIYSALTITLAEENPTLREALNFALQNKTPSAMYLGSASSEKVKELADFSVTVNSVIQTELDRRQTKDLLILKTLSLQNDTEFIHYWEHLYSECLKTWRPEHPAAQDNTFTRAYFSNYLTENIQQSLGTNLTALSDAKLRLLRKQCEIWSPKISPRILCCHTIPDDYQIADTLILPDGVYQMRMNSDGKIIKETIIDAQSMTNYPQLLEHHPNVKTDVLILDHHSKNDQKKALATLRQSLNTIIEKKPNGMYLDNIVANSTNTYGAILNALKKIVEAELRTRLVRQYKTPRSQAYFLKFSGVFQSNGKAVHSASDQNSQKFLATKQDFRTLPNKETQAPINTGHTQITTHSKKMTTTELSKAAKHLKHLQKTDPILQTVTPSPASMLIHSLTPAKSPRILNQVESAIEEVITELKSTDGSNAYKPFRDETKQTIQIINNKTNALCMEASTDSVVVYRPLLKANIEDADKAALFLQALGVPPASGKPDIVVRGGHSTLRKAIRQLFREYRQNEQLESERTQSDTASFSSRK